MHWENVCSSMQMKHYASRYPRRYLPVASLSSISIKWEERKGRKKVYRLACELAVSTKI